MKKIIVFLADGCEEIESVATIDILRRAGFETDTVTINSDTLVTGAHGIKLVADYKTVGFDASGYDACVLPGGLPGATNLQADEFVKNTVLSMNESGKLVAAICAAPTVLAAFGILDGKKACCYPGMEDGLKGANYVNEVSVCDGNIITGRGPGAAVDFALAIVKYFNGDKAQSELAEQLVHVM